jgi:ADP-L-glycero-D-manno-heptose 6-epimerase
MIVVTGTMGFIGSAMVSFLNRMGRQDLIVVDDFYQWKKENNMKGKRVHDWVHRDLFLNYFEKIAPHAVDAVIHLGARTDTISEDTAVFDRLNLHYSQRIWEICATNNIPLVYASSAATYGNGAHGFSDDHDSIGKLEPMNAYAKSKLDFDKWALQQKDAPPTWYGLRFFNVYGPNEYHKGRMASVVFHAFHQIRQTGELKLFKSHHPDYIDGGQLRDFIYVEDILNMIWDILQKRPASGLYNVGTGQERAFADLGKAVFHALDLDPDLVYIDMPEDLRHKYQYFTRAEMTKWTKAGLSLPATSLEDGVSDYVRNYLIPGKYY